MNETVDDCDLLKKKHEILNPDSRIAFFVGGPDKNFKLFYDELSSINLEANVPKEVVIQFETSKNTLLFSFYAYRLSTVAILYAYSSLENALNLRLNPDDAKGLKKKLKLAIKRNFIRLEDVPYSQGYESLTLNDRIDKGLEDFCNFRNSLAHGQSFLDSLWNVPKRLASVAILINALFRDPVEPLKMGGIVSVEQET